MFVFSHKGWLAAALLFVSFPLFAQQPVLTQVVRGTVTDRTTATGISGARIALLIPGKDTLFATSEETGDFRIEAVPLGRHDIAFSATGYRPFIRPGVPVESGRETVLEVVMEVIVYQINTVVIQPVKERGTSANEMAAVSAISFSPEETRRFAGGFDDPVRAAAYFPGVNSVNFFSNNSLSVRGNSPRGMLYRLEGVDIPTPAHFVPLGSTGGTFTIFSQQVLGNSDFYTGAFAAEYGNATTGVFDVKFRRGDNRERAYTLSAGVLGIDLAAEGPLSKGSNASYLVNYRYSSLGLARLLINYLTVPVYQDLSFNLSFPTKKAGTFTVFGIGGLSSRDKNMEFEEDSTGAVIEPKIFLDSLTFSQQRLVLVSNMGVIGGTHTLLLNGKSVWKTSVAAFGTQQKDNTYFNPTTDGLNELATNLNEYRRSGITGHTSLRTRFSPRITALGGLLFTVAQHQVYVANYDWQQAALKAVSYLTGSTAQFQGYYQAKFSLSAKVNFHAGVHALYYNLNNKFSLEPRAALTWQVNEGNSLSLGYGRHSRVEDYAVYAFRASGEGKTQFPNQSLNFAKADHLVLGWYSRPFENHRLRVEAYYQQLTGVPANGAFSLVNLYELDMLSAMTNTASGRNAGIDVGLERFTDHGLYYLLNASFLRSDYRDADTAVWRSSQFDNRYNVRALFGKEWRTGEVKGKFNSFGANVSLSFIGGRPYSPIDLAASREARETIPDWSAAFSLRENNMYFVDWTFTHTRNRPKYTSKWIIQIKNLPYKNSPEFREYDYLQDSYGLNAVVEKKATNFFPNIAYSVSF